MIVTWDCRTRNCLIKGLAIYHMTCSLFLCILHVDLNLLQSYLHTQETRTNVRLLKTMVPLALLLDFAGGTMTAVAANNKDEYRYVLLISAIVMLAIHLPLQVLLEALLCQILTFPHHRLSTDAPFIFLARKMAYACTHLLTIGILVYLAIRIRAEKRAAEVVERTYTITPTADDIDIRRAAGAKLELEAYKPNSSSDAIATAS